jgi:hypothetical protein
MAASREPADESLEVAHGLPEAFVGDAGIGSRKRRFGAETSLGAPAVEREDEKGDVHSQAPPEPHRPYAALGPVHAAEIAVDQDRDWTRLGVRHDARRRNAILDVAVVLFLNFREEAPVVARPRDVDDPRSVVSLGTDVLGGRDIRRLREEMFTGSRLRVPLGEPSQERQADLVPEAVGALDPTRAREHGSPDCGVEPSRRNTEDASCAESHCRMTRIV